MKTSSEDLVKVNSSDQISSFGVPNTLFRHTSLVRSKRSAAKGLHLWTQ